VVFGAGGACGTDGRGLFKVPGAGGLLAAMADSVRRSTARSR
jgi:hypothetical protein